MSRLAFALNNRLLFAQGLAPGTYRVNVPQVVLPSTDRNIQATLKLTNVGQGGGVFGIQGKVLKATGSNTGIGFRKTGPFAGSSANITLNPGQSQTIDFIAYDTMNRIYWEASPWDYAIRQWKNVGWDEALDVAWIISWPSPDPKNFPELGGTVTIITPQALKMPAVPVAPPAPSPAVEIVYR